MRHSITTAALSVLVVSPLSAAEFGPEVDRAIEQCLDAARRDQVGQVTRWDLEWTTGLAFNLELVSPNDRVWNMRCEGGVIVKSERKAANKKYEMLSTRHRVEEHEARQLAGAEYAGGELHRMTYDLSWRGQPYYNYSFNLPDGRTATVLVNAVTGVIDKTSSERK